MRRLREISLELTNRCYQKCIHCSSEAGVPFGNEFTFKEIKNIIDQAIKLGLESVILTGGEPLLRKDIEKVIKYLRKNKIFIKIISSGFFINKGRPTSISNKFLDFFRKNLSKNDIIAFSILGNKKIHEKINRTKGSFDIVSDSIRKTKEAGIKVGVQTTITTFNQKQLDEIKEFLIERKINNWHLLRLVVQGRCEKNPELELNEKEFKILQKKLIKISKEKLPFKLTISHNLDRRYWENSSYPIQECSIGKYRLFFRSNGEITYCCAIISKPNFGNVREKSLEYFWYNHPFIVNTRNFLEGKKNSIKGKCHTCDISAQCRGGCIAQRLYKYNNDLYQGPDPLCYK